MNHGPRFWNLVERTMPRHEARTWLRKHGARACIATARKGCWLPPTAARPSAVSSSLSAGKNAEHAAVERLVPPLRRRSPDARGSLFEPRRVRSGKRRRLLSLMGIGHEVVPEPRRQGAAGYVAHLRAVVIADPHASGVMGGVADEPGVARALAVPVLPPAI